LAKVYSAKIDVTKIYAREKEFLAVCGWSAVRSRRSANAGAADDNDIRLGGAAEVEVTEIDALKIEGAEIDVAEHDAEVDTHVEIEGRRLTRADNADGVGERKGFQRVSERFGKCRGDGLEGPREVVRWTYTAASGKACHRKAHHV
jgi:hypothetical protein